MNSTRAIDSYGANWLERKCTEIEIRGVCQVNVELIHIGSQWKLRQKIW